MEFKSPNPTHNPEVVGSRRAELRSLASAWRAKLARESGPVTTVSCSHCEAARGDTLPSTGSMSATGRVQTRA